MGKLIFHVQADYDKVIKLREEIAKLRSELSNMNSSQTPAAFTALNTRLQQSTSELNNLTLKAAQAGATVEQKFKNKIYDASQTTNDLTEKIIAQKSVVKDVEGDVKRLADAYRDAMKNQPMAAQSRYEEYMSAKKALDEEKASLFGLTQEKAQASLETKRLNDQYKLFSASTGDVVMSNKQLMATIEGMPGPIGATAGGIKAMTVAAKAFIATPLGMILGAIAAALAAVTSWFHRTEEGQNALRIATAVFNQVLNSTLDVVDKVGEWIYKAFTEPKQAIKDLGQFIESQILNRFKAFGKIGKSIVEILTGDFKKGFSDLGNAWAQGVTGIEDAGKKASQWMDNTNKKVIENMNLAKRKNALDKKEREWLVEKARLEAGIAKNREKAYDESIPEKQRAKYIKEASRLTSQMYATEKKIANEKYEIKKKENSLSNSNKEDKMEEAQLKANTVQLDASESMAQRMLLRQMNRFNRADKSAGKAAATNRAKMNDELLSLQRKNQQDEINLMEEGTEKKLKQIDLDYQREKATIAKQESEWKKSGITKEQSLAISIAYTDADKKKTVDTQNVFKELLDKYQGYTDKRKAIEEKFIEDKKNLTRAGASKETLDELEFQKEKALNNVDNEFAQRSEDFKLWATSVTNMSLEKLNELLAKAKAELAKMEAENPDDPKLAEQRAKINTLTDKIKTVKVPTPEAKSLKAWQDMYATLQRVSKGFNEIGKEIGGTAGEFISAAGEVATSTVSMIDGAKTLMKGYTETIDNMGNVTKTALTSIQKASIILTVITSALQIISKINSFIKDSYQQYEAYANKLKEINALTDAVNEYRVAALKAQQAEQGWFSTDNLKNLRDYKKLHDAITDQYNKKINESQAVYQNQSGGGWLKTLWKPITKVWDTFYGSIYGNGVQVDKEYEKNQTAAINNLRIETKKAKSGFLGTGIGGKSQKTEELQSWINSNKDLFKGLDTNLFDKDNMINATLAQKLLDNVGDKLVGQTKETLEELIKIKKEYDDYMDKMHEYVSSMYEPLVENFTDSLWDWFNEGKDALDSFKNYASDTFKNIVTDMMKTIVLDKVVGTFSKDITDIYDKYANGKIDEKSLMQEVADRTSGLIGDYQKNIPQIEEIMKSVSESLKAAGIDLTKSSSYSQEATSKGFETMSQDTASELNGRFTALQMSGEKQVEQLTIVNATMADIKAIHTEQRDIASDSRDIMASSYLELVGIRENTEAIIKPIKQMQSDIAKIKDNTK